MERSPHNTSDVPRPTSHVLLLFLLLTLAAPIASGATLVNTRTFRMNEGDDPAWADAEFDDSAWTQVRLIDIDTPTGIIWLRARITIERETTDSYHPYGIFWSALASHEIYWDGVLIGRGGVPGDTPDEETPGPIQAHYVISDSLATPGEHVISIRTSAHHIGFEPRVGFWVLLSGDHDALLVGMQKGTWISLASLSGLLIAAIFALVLFLTDRRDRSYLLLALFGFAAAALLIAESWRNLFGYSYDLHLVRLSFILGLTVLLTVLLLVFVVVRFPGKGVRQFAIIAALLLSASMFMPGWDGKTIVATLAGLFLSFVWSARAASQRKRGALLAVLGLGSALLMLLARPYIFSDLTLFFAIDFLMLCLLGAHALQVRDEREQRESALLKSARLEIELLKRHIQPHFLMNTLTALSEWIEEDPATAVRMIELLGDEFRTLSTISHEKQVSLATEIELCRNHLAIMSLRKGKTYELELEGVEPAGSIPPAVIHTLIENAVTHDRGSLDKVVCRLTEVRTDGNRRLTLTTPMSGAKVETSDEGTGLRYVRARLQESFGDDWSLSSGSDQGVWRTELTFPMESEH